MARPKESIKTELNEEDEDSRFMATGLSTGLKPRIGFKTTKHGSNNIKGFLTEIGKPSLRRISNVDVLNTWKIKPAKYTKSV